LLGCRVCVCVCCGKGCGGEGRAFFDLLALLGHRRVPPAKELAAVDSDIAELVMHMMTAGTRCVYYASSCCVLEVKGRACAGIQGVGMCCGEGSGV
jgi:hypothetical protein